MIDVETVNAASTITLLEAIEALYPMLALIHVFLDNARYHHAKLVQEWLARPDCRIKLHFIPTYCPHLNPIERLWGVMHRNVTHNKPTQLAPNSPMRRSISCAKKFRAIGPNSAIPSPTIFASSIRRIFGLSGERGIASFEEEIRDLSGSPASAVAERRPPSSCRRVRQN
jgi:transposase